MMLPAISSLLILFSAWPGSSILLARGDIHAHLPPSRVHITNRAASTTAASALAQTYSLTTSTSLPFPTATLSNGTSWIMNQWSLSKGRVQNGQDDIAFVNDPYPGQGVSSSSSEDSPVLQVTYPAGSYSHATGGAQFINLWNSSDNNGFQSMMLSYEVAFQQDFNWILGGKLPGLRGGSVIDGCSGGNEPNGTDCFSTRLMWRQQGAGEVYAYLPDNEHLCSESDVICNSDYGISFDRGSFTFTNGSWNRITLLVQMNEPNASDGNLILLVNDATYISRGGLEYRTSSDVTIGGLFFSTFFGGNDDSYATPVTTYTYYRNFQMWASGDPSTLTASSSSPFLRSSHSGLRLFGSVFVTYVVLILFV